MLISKLIEAKVDIIFCDEKRLPVAQTLPYYGRHDSSLQIQKQIGWRDEVKAKLWTDIIANKIKNQANFLNQQSMPEKAHDVMKMLEGLEVFDPSNREGHAARTYFNSLFGNKFSRDLENDINAGLDYGYTLIMSLFAREIVKNGCLSQLGLKHSNQFNDFNLASDLMEAFRPLVDDIVYEHRNEEFPVIKRQLLNLFTKKYSYRNSEMFLTNIVADYVKRIISILNAGIGIIPEIEI